MTAIVVRLPVGVIAKTVQDTQQAKLEGFGPTNLYDLGLWDDGLYDQAPEFPFGANAEVLLGPGEVLLHHDTEVVSLKSGQHVYLDEKTVVVKRLGI